MDGGINLSELGPYSSLDFVAIFKRSQKANRFWQIAETALVHGTKKDRISDYVWRPCMWDQHWQNKKPVVRPLRVRPLASQLWSCSCKNMDKKWHVHSIHRMRSRSEAVVQLARNGPEKKGMKTELHCNADFSTDIPDFETTGKPCGGRVSGIYWSHVPRKTPGSGETASRFQHRMVLQCSESELQTASWEQTFDWKILGGH